MVWSKKNASRSRPRKGFKPGRKSAYQEHVDAQWLQDVLSGKILVKDVQPKQIVLERIQISTIVDKKTGESHQKESIVKKVVEQFDNGQHALAYHILTGNIAILQKVLDKIVATKLDHTSGDETITGGFIAIPQRDLE
jgi:hypothetical protein